MRLKKNQLAVAMITVSFFLITLGFNNCAKPDYSGWDTSSPSPNQTTPGDDDLTDVKAPEFKSPDALILACAAARSEGRLVGTRLSRSVNARSGCDWGVSGNLSKASTPAEIGTNRARREEVEVFEVPPAADGSKRTICSLKLSTDSVANFSYSEVLMFNLNNHILASSTNLTKYLESREGAYIYDWNHLVGYDGQMDAADSTPDQQYCAGSLDGISTCTLPQSGASGAADFQLDDQVVQRILGMTNEKTLSLGIVTTGDDDNSDCSHGALQLHLDVEYISN